jgi:general L-amino acid transport system permease protein
MSDAIVDLGSEPGIVPPPVEGPRVRSGTSRWIRRNLFRSPLDGVMTVVFGAIAAWVLYKSISFVFVTGRWEIIRVNLQLLLIGRYPEAHVPRLAVSIVVLAAWAGLIAGIIHARRLQHGATAVRRSVRATMRDLAGRFGLAALVVLYLLVLAGTPGPWITVGLALVGAVLGRMAGGRLGRIKLAPAASVGVVLTLAAVPIAVYLYIVTAVGFDEWGGFLLNLFLAVCSIILCFPLGVLLALGRRSGLPLARWMCTVYIEVIRGAPLYVLLLLANIALGFFVPSNLAPSTATRAIVVFTLFTAAYMAEIVRGGLQSVPRGQVEAAKALGLSPVRQTSYIVLPQALRNVIPAQIGQLISLFKDTSLAGLAMALFELLQVSDAITAQQAFSGQGLSGETITFAALLFWIVAFTMSRESQRLERRLGVGTR